MGVDENTMLAGDGETREKEGKIKEERKIFGGCEVGMAPTKYF